MDRVRSEYDRRQHSRYAVDWVASIMHKSAGGGEIFHDRICDISLGGAGFLSDTDVYTEMPVVMLIATPLQYGKLRTVITGIECSLCKPLFWEERQQFHTGVQFLRFHGVGKHLLAETLFAREAAPGRRHEGGGRQFQ